MKFIIKDQNIYGFIDEIKKIKKEGISRRVSLVIPENKILRFLFILIRKLKIKKLDNFTRKWNCRWIVIINGEVVYKGNNRNKALEFEKIFIKKYGIRKIFNNNNNNLDFNFKLLKY